jgi:hypothetical protein
MAVAPNGSRVYVTGFTNFAQIHAANTHEDYTTIAYSTS